jgi:hypothetical protein
MIGRHRKAYPEINWEILHLTYLRIDLLPDVFCLMVRIFRLMLVLYIKTVVTLRSTQL